MACFQIYRDCHIYQLFSEFIQTKKRYPTSLGNYLSHQTKIFLVNLTPIELAPCKISHICHCTFNVEARQRLQLQHLMHCRHCYNLGFQLVLLRWTNKVVCLLNFRWIYVFLYLIVTTSESYLWTDNTRQRSAWAIRLCTARQYKILERYQTRPQKPEEIRNQPTRPRTPFHSDRFLSQSNHAF